VRYWTGRLDRADRRRGIRPLNAICDDITTLSVDAIVNAANASLMGGGGVDGAIHRAAGPRLLHECRLLGGCKTGEAKLTGGHGLPARFIVHTVGPVWHGGGDGEDELLASCYRKSCELASAQPAIRTLAFPCISTGIYGFPFERAARIAIRECAAHTDRLITTFCCFSERDRNVYSQLLEEHGRRVAD